MSRLPGNGGMPYEDDAERPAAAAQSIDAVPYTVGYRKPPTATRFQAGRSGNPRGRPKGSLNLRTMVQRAFNKRVLITVNGKPRRMTRPELAIEQSLVLAAKGDFRALSTMLKLMTAFMPPPPETGASGDPETDALLLQQLIEAGRYFAGAPLSTPKDAPLQTTKTKDCDEEDQS